MSVTMVQIGEVRVPMAHGSVAVPVRVRLGYGAIVAVQMVIVMYVAMLMFNEFMVMRMSVTFGEVNPKAEAHQ